VVENKSLLQVKVEACYPGVIFEVFKCPAKVFQEGKAKLG
jgi:hypothetical protein